MSHQEDKDKHSARLHKEEAAIRRQVKIAKAHGVTVKEPHTLAKHHALDCGQPGCMLCGNPRKTFKEETKQEKSFKQTESWND